jgi:hypothetical protein
MTARAAHLRSTPSSDLSSDIHGDMRACEPSGGLLQRFLVLAAAQLEHRPYQRTGIAFALATSGSTQERRTSP